MQGARPSLVGKGNESAARDRAAPDQKPSEARGIRLNSGRTVHGSNQPIRTSRQQQSPGILPNDPNEDPSPLAVPCAVSLLSHASSTYVPPSKTNRGQVDRPLPIRVSLSRPASRSSTPRSSDRRKHRSIHLHKQSHAASLQAVPPHLFISCTPCCARNSNTCSTSRCGR